MEKLTFEELIGWLYDMEEDSWGEPETESTYRWVRLHIERRLKQDSETEKAVTNGCS